MRPGIAVYGLTPVPQLGGPEAYGLTPAMTLVARLALVKRLPAGQGVSYGHAYNRSAEHVVGLVPPGMPTASPARHQRRPGVGPWVPNVVAGRVCMDQFVVDLGPGLDARAGDVVVLFGGGPGDPTAQGWADATETISYEIVTRIGPRVPRVYVGGDA